MRSPSQALLILILIAPARAEPPYRSSVVGTDFDFITDADPSAFVRLSYHGLGLPEMPDKRNNRWPLHKKAHLFVAAFSDRTHVQISVHAGLGDKKAARQETMRYAPRIGKLPTSLRRGLKRVIVQPGGRDTTAFADEGLFVVYSDNATRRIATHDLEETIFHESVHAAWDKQYRNSDAWKRAQKTDGRFLTRYAQRHPSGEDLAESALFAFTMTHHPKRFPAADRKLIRETIPARIAFVAGLVPAGKPIHFRVPSNRDAVLRTVKADKRRLAQAPNTPVHDGWRKPDDAPCRADLTKTGILADILSNALVRGLKKSPKTVSNALNSRPRGTRPHQLLQSVAKRLGVTERELVAEVRRYLHCNCKHGAKSKKFDETKMNPLERALAR